MPGQKNMLVGAAFFSIGLLITLITYSAAPGGYYVVAYGAILAGGLQAIVGVFQYLAYAAKSPEKKIEHHAKVDARVIVRAMIAVSASDGMLEDSEISMIGLITKQIFGQSLDDETVRKIYESLSKNQKDLDEELENIANQVTPGGARMAILACAMVAYSDGNLDKSELDRVQKIAGLLGMGASELSSVLDEGRQIVLSIVRAASKSEGLAAEAGGKSKPT